MNILVIDIDSLRPDHLGCYGYEPGISPAIDALAAEGTVFENAYAANSPSLPSRANIVTGRYGISNGVVTHGPDAYTPSSPHTWDTLDRHRRAYWTLPELFFKEGVTTGAIAPDTRHPAPWFYHVWDEVLQPREPAGEDEFFMTVRGDAVVDAAHGFIGRHAEEDFFLYTQFWEPHPPYRVDEAVDAADVPLPQHPSGEQIQGQEGPERWCTDVDVESRDDLRELIAAYDEAVKAVDHHIGQLMDILREAGVYDETLIVLTADHGEEFGEHGIYREHWSVYEGTQRLPLIVKPPAGQDARDRSGKLVSNVDIAPTLADYAGFEQPRAWQGRSLGPLLTGSADGWRDRVVLEHGLYTVQRAVRKGDWKLVRTLHPGLWEDRLPPIQLFDLGSDPWEQADVSAEHPDKVQELRREMTRFVDEHAGRDGDPLKDVAEQGPVGSTVYETQ